MCFIAPVIYFLKFVFSVCTGNIYNFVLILIVLLNRVYRTAVLLRSTEAENAIIIAFLS